MLYEYLVRTQGTSSMDNLEGVGAKLGKYLSGGEPDAYAELGWELWQVSLLNDANGNNGLVIVYRRPKDSK